MVFVGSIVGFKMLLFRVSICKASYIYIYFTLVLQNFSPTGNQQARISYPKEDITTAPSSNG